MLEDEEFVDHASRVVRAGESVLTNFCEIYFGSLLFGSTLSILYFRNTACNIAYIGGYRGETGILMGFCNQFKKRYQAVRIASKSYQSEIKTDYKKAKILGKDIKVSGEMY